MQPYIDPSFFYWASVLDNLKIVLNVIGIVCLIAVAIIVFVCWVCALDSGEFVANIKKSLKGLIVIASIGTAMVVIAAFVPSEAVLTKMMVARAITPDNVSKGVETVKEAVDYIVQKIAEIK